MIHVFRRVTNFRSTLPGPYHNFLTPAFSMQHHGYNPDRSGAHYQHYKHHRDPPTATLLLSSPLSPLLLLQASIAVSMISNSKVISDRRRHRPQRNPVFGIRATVRRGIEGRIVDGLDGGFGE